MRRDDKNESHRERKTSQKEAHWSEMWKRNKLLPSPQLQKFLIYCPRVSFVSFAFFQFLFYMIQFRIKFLWIFLLSCWWYVCHCMFMLRTEKVEISLVPSFAPAFYTTAERKIYALAKKWKQNSTHDPLLAPSSCSS